MSILPLGEIPLEDLYRLLQPITLPSTSSRARFSNWGQTYHCKPLAVFEPETEWQCELILELARREKKVVRAVGVGHSPSDLACTRGFMLRTEKFNRVLEVNVEKRFVIAQAGITLNDLHAHLASYDLAMRNVGSISDQTLAGIVTTATHGTGITYGVMSTHILSLTLLLADGTRVECSRHEHADLFTATICGLGSTGLILSIQLEVEPAFRLREIQESLPFDEVVQNLDQLVYSAEHVRFWWFPAADSMRVSALDRTKEPKSPTGSWFWHSFVGFHLVQLFLFLGRYFLFLNNWVGRFACWLDNKKTVGVNDSHVIFNLDCRIPQYTTEWAIPYHNTQACLRELHAWLAEEQKDPYGARPHFPIEIRFSAADDIWLSPSNGQKTCWIGIIQYRPYNFNVPYRKLFSVFESIVLRHQGRPHWAKAHGLKPETLRRLYPHFDPFVCVLEKFDPHGMFRNEYIQRHIFGQSVGARVFKLRQ